ncbi:MAG: D-2-hydroxyacid dehydrogenase [Verrucomicrobiales bacterium]|nr:D-2-hydroxyacid dehydrogenase [Verrucomicrobiales bacterium]
MNIVIADGQTANPGDLSWAELEALGQVTVRPRTPVEEMAAACAGAEAVITNKAILNAEIIAALPELRYIGVAATGYNVVDIEAARARGIVVTNVPAYSTASVAQLVFALILELTHRVGDHSASVRTGDWEKCPDFSYWTQNLVELDGRTLGVIGYGDIGSAVARIGAAFGMRVLASRRSWPDEPPAGVTPATTDEIFAQADVVTLHCPLTEQTHHLVNERTLGLMKPDAYLINTGRGPLVDEAALAQALEAGKIAGAGLDVLTQEPPRAGNPLIGVRRCLITPHIGWATREARRRLIAQVAANLRAWRENAPINVVGR